MTAERDRLALLRFPLGEGAIGCLETPPQGMDRHNMLSDRPAQRAANVDHTAPYFIGRHGFNERNNTPRHRELALPDSAVTRNSKARFSCRQGEPELISPFALKGLLTMLGVGPYLLIWLALSFGFALLMGRLFALTSDPLDDTADHQPHGDCWPHIIINQGRK